MTDRAILGKNLKKPVENLGSGGWAFATTRDVTTYPGGTGVRGDGGGLTTYRTNGQDAEDYDTTDPLGNLGLVSLMTGLTEGGAGEVAYTSTNTISGVQLQGNAWKRSGIRLKDFQSEGLGYAVDHTAQTFVYTTGMYMSLDYKQEGREAEIQGITFVANDNATGSTLGGVGEGKSDIFWQFGGTEDYGTSTPNPYYRTYKTSDFGTWKTYFFELTGLAEGETYNIVLVQDADTITTTQDSVVDVPANPGQGIPAIPVPRTYFKNIKIGTPNTGLYISASGSSVVSDSPGDFIFSSDDGFFQPLKSGRVAIPPASEDSIGKEGVANVYTGIVSPHYDDTPLMVSWNIVVESANIHPLYNGALFGGIFPYTGPVEVISNLSSIGTQFIDDVNQWQSEIESQNRVIPQVGLSCISIANTTTDPNSIDLQFRNGSTLNTQLVFWTVYRERGMPEVKEL